MTDRQALGELLTMLAFPHGVTYRLPSVSRGVFSTTAVLAVWSFALLTLAGLVAQSVEQRPFKPLVPGSSPGQPTTLETGYRACK